MGVELKLSIHQDEIYKRSRMENELLKDEIAGLPEIKEGQVLIDAVYTVKWEDYLEVGVYFRNATAYNTAFSHTLLTLISPKGEVYKTQVFDLKELGDMPPYSVRPWRVNFIKDRPIDDNLSTGWKICFTEGSIQPYAKVIEDQKPDPLNQGQLLQLNAFIKNLQPVNKDEISVDIFSVEKKETREVLVNLVIRHGYQKPRLLNRFPICLFDAKKDCVAKAIFEIEPFALEPKMFFMRTFTFGSNTILNENMDLSNYGIAFF